MGYPGISLSTSPLLHGLVAAARWPDDDPGLLVGLLAGLVVVALIIILIAIRKWSARRSDGTLKAQILSNAAVTPRHVTDPAARARIDELRKAFAEGLSAYVAKTSQRLSTLPLYLLIGEPGAGKTQAVRHAQPNATADSPAPLPGAGGTLDADWWLTDAGIVLDAGRTLGDEQRRADEHFRGFLELLARYRPTAPINGVIVTLSAESLLLDDDATARLKAESLALQLDALQRALRVRYPVYVLVTKCDVLCGFRQFTDSLEPALREQIFGWVNDTPLDQPFKAARFDSAFGGIVGALAAARTQLLLSSASQTGGIAAAQRDALYALPDSMARMGPRLRTYVEAMFDKGEWLPALFFRGMFFTSALKHGAVLDPALADWLSIPVAQGPDADPTLPAEGAAFLRGAFRKCIVKERRLVTRAASAARVSRRRTLVVVAVGGVAALLLVVLTLQQRGQLQRTFGRRAQALGELGANPGMTWPIVTQSPDGHIHYAGQDVALHLPGGDLTPVDIAADVDGIGSAPVVPILYRPWTSASSSADPSKSPGLTLVRRLFDQNVIAPLVSTSRSRLWVEQKWDDAAVNALGEMLRLEATVDAGPGKGGGGSATDLTALFKYVLSADDFKRYSPEGDAVAAAPAGSGGRESDRQRLERAYHKLYTTGDWPPAWLASRSPDDRSADAITQAVRSYAGHIVATALTDDPTLKALARLSDDLVGGSADRPSFASAEAEAAAANAAATRPSNPLGKDDLRRALNALAAASKRIEQDLAALGDNPRGIDALFDDAMARSTATALGNLSRLQALLDPRRGGAQEQQYNALADAARQLNAALRGPDVAKRRAMYRTLQERYLSRMDPAGKASGTLRKFQSALRQYEGAVRNATPPKSDRQ